QHRVHAGALDAIVGGANVALLAGGRFVRIGRQGETLRAEFADAGLELRHGRTDVRQLDDVRVRLLDDAAELGEVVAAFLVIGQHVGECGQHAPGEGYVARLDEYVGCAGEGAHDG